MRSGFYKEGIAAWLVLGPIFLAYLLIRWLFFSP